MEFTHIISELHHKFVNKPIIKCKKPFNYINQNKQKLEFQIKMILSVLVCDTTGYPFYSRKIDPSIGDMDPAIFSGLISAIGAIGKQLFKEEIATISYGENYEITIITKELFGDDKSIYFVFLIEGEPDLPLMKKLSTNIFIETKHVLKNPSAAKLDIKEKVDKIISNSL